MDLLADDCVDTGRELFQLVPTVAVGVSVVVPAFVGRRSDLSPRQPVIGAVDEHASANHGRAGLRSRIAGRRRRLRPRRYGKKSSAVTSQRTTRAIQHLGGVRRQDDGREGREGQEGQEGQERKAFSAHLPIPPTPTLTCPILPPILPILPIAASSFRPASRRSKFSSALNTRK